MRWFGLGRRRPSVEEIRAKAERELANKAVSSLDWADLPWEECAVLVRLEEGPEHPVTRQVDAVAYLEGREPEYRIVWNWKVGPYAENPVVAWPGGG